MNNQQMIQRYAYLMTGIERANARNQRVPPKVLHEVQRIEAKAQAVMTPQEVQYALTAANSLRAQYHAQAELSEARRGADQQYRNMEQMAQEMGTTVDQFRAARAGKPVPVRGARFRPNKAKAEIERAAKGLGLTFKQLDKIADTVEEKRLAGKDYDGYLKGKFGKHYAQGKALVEGYQESGIGIALGLADRVGVQDKDYTYEPNERDILRAEIQDAWLGEVERGSGEFSGGGISKDYLQSEHITGDIARAFAVHDTGPEVNTNDYEFEETAHAE